MTDFKTSIDISEYEAYVREGVKLLDERIPDWRDRIVAPLLDVQRFDECVLGQLFASETEEEGLRSWSAYDVGLRELKVRADEAYMFGFDTPPNEEDDDEGYALLTALWRDMLRDS